MTSRSDATDSSAEGTNSSAGSEDGASVDRSPPAVCYRCGESVPAGRVLAVSTSPGPDLAERYAAVTRACCPDCAAAIGMLALSNGPRAGSSAGSD
ncbi:hypothetical protein [Halostagnicola bangensis]